MAMTLPPSIRPYWSTLTAEKAAAPAHRAWEWSPDPFAAKKEVEERQNKRKEKDEKTAAAGGSGTSTPASRGTASGGASGPGGKSWDSAPEVRMAPGLREMVEGVVRKVRCVRCCSVAS